MTITTSSDKHLFAPFFQDKSTMDNLTSPLSKCGKGLVHIVSRQGFVAEFKNIVFLAKSVTIFKIKSDFVRSHFVSSSDREIKGIQLL